MRLSLAIIALAGVLGLAACAPSVPDSAAGVGFGDYNSYLAQQRARNAPPGVNPPRQVVSLPPQPYSPAVPTARAEAPAPLPEAQSIATAAVAAVRPQATAGVGPATGTGLRDVAPVSAPPAVFDAAGGPNVMAYAIATTHAVGTPRHPRSRLTLQSSARNCAGFASSDLAQEEFMRRGGPERDPMNLDPDGDGFACDWSPEPFRAAARAAR